jgi:hypothetical protein
MAMLFALLAVATAGKPNILFLMADEMDGRIMDPTSQQVHPPMPNLSKLAAAGAVMTTTYSESPQCVPSRSSMMAGLRTDQIMVYDNFVGMVATNGNASDPDHHCVQSFGKAACLGELTLVDWCGVCRNWLQTVAACVGVGVGGTGQSLPRKLHTLASDRVRVIRAFCCIVLRWLTYSHARPRCYSLPPAFAKQQQAPATWIDQLHTGGYNITLYGKMHVGGGLDR